MTTTQDTTLVFKDQAGDYYLLPQATIEGAKVPAERTAEVERLVGAATGGEGDDTRGHFIPLLFLAGCAAFGGGFAVGYGFQDLYLD